MSHHTTHHTYARARFWLVSTVCISMLLVLYLGYTRAMILVRIRTDDMIGPSMGQQATTLHLRPANHESSSVRALLPGSAEGALARRSACVVPNFPLL